jgi:hypothetical protein
MRLRSFCSGPPDTRGGSRFALRSERKEHEPCFPQTPLANASPPGPQRCLTTFAVTRPHCWTQGGAWLALRRISITMDVSEVAQEQRALRSPPRRSCAGPPAVAEEPGENVGVRKPEPTPHAGGRLLVHAHGCSRGWYLGRPDPLDENRRAGRVEPFGHDVAGASAIGSLGASTWQG